MTFQAAIRPLGVGDLPRVAWIARRTWPATYPHFPEEGIARFLAWAYDLTHLAGELDDPAIRAWAAESDGQVVAYAHLRLAPPGALLQRLYVLPEHQGEGLGHALLAQAVEAATAAGCEELALRVAARNRRARRFYEQRGFELDAIAPVEAEGLAWEEATYRLPLA